MKVSNTGDPYDNGAVLRTVLRLDGIKHHTDQILERPYAGCPGWLMGKFGLQHDTKLEKIEAKSPRPATETETADTSAFTAAKSILRSWRSKLGF